MYLDLEYRRGHRLRSTGGGVQVRQQLLTCLLERHYGLTLNDTPFHDDASIQEYIEAGITLADAVNFLWNAMSWCALIAKDLPGRSRHRS
jgi:hypothetical protein